MLLRGSRSSPLEKTRAPADELWPSFIFSAKLGGHRRVERLRLRFYLDEIAPARGPTPLDTGHRRRDVCSRRGRETRDRRCLRWRTSATRSPTLSIACTSPGLHTGPSSHWRFPAFTCCEASDGVARWSRRPDSERFAPRTQLLAHLFERARHDRQTCRRAPMLRSGDLEATRSASSKSGPKAR